MKLKTKIKKSKMKNTALLTSARSRIFCLAALVMLMVFLRATIRDIIIPICSGGILSSASGL